MKTIKRTLFNLLPAVFIFLFTSTAFAQGTGKVPAKAPLYISGEVVDANGNLVSKEICDAAAWDETAVFKLKKNAEGKSVLVYTPFTAEQIDSVQKIPLPRESKYFSAGEKYGRINTTDIEGKRIDTKNMKGKIIVLDYWRISCSACKGMITGLNNLTKRYKEDDDVVFISIYVDEASDVKEFLSKHPFNFRVIDNGSFLTEKNNIKTFPVYVVVDRDGRVYFHTDISSQRTLTAINRSIKEIKAKAGAAK